MATDASGLSRDDAREPRSMPAGYERQAALLRITNVLKVLRPKLDKCEGWMGTPWSVPSTWKCAVAGAVILLPAVAATSAWAPLQWLGPVWFDVCLAVIFPSDRDLTSEERCATKTAMLAADYTAAATPVLLYSILPITSSYFDFDNPFNEVNPVKNLNCYLGIDFYASAIMWVEALLTTMWTVMRGLDRISPAMSGFGIGKAICTIVFIALMASTGCCANSMCYELEEKRKGRKLVLLTLSLCPFIDYINDARLQVSLMVERIRLSCSELTRRVAGTQLVATALKTQLERPQVSATAGAPDVLSGLCGQRKNPVERPVERCTHRHDSDAPGSCRRLHILSRLFLCWSLATKQGQLTNI
jgi:hypothetical protein